MNATTVAVDLAKNVFELVAADQQWNVIERARLTRRQFERWFDNRAVRLVLMEACATSHYWARTLRTRGIEVRLLPAHYVRAYVKRNKTDAADALALLEAARACDITPVAVKSVEQGAPGASPAALRLDDDPHATDQYAARLLPRVRHGSIRWRGDGARTDRTATCR
jgi:transposase